MWPPRPASGSSSSPWSTISATGSSSSLEAVDFIDSTGLGVLISGLKRVRTHDGEFALVCTEPRILKVFEITGLLAVFPVFGTIDDAVAA